jgi:hypothetical protein
MHQSWQLFLLIIWWLLTKKHQILFVTTSVKKETTKLYCIHHESGFKFGEVWIPDQSHNSYSWKLDQQAAKRHELESKKKGQTQCQRLPHEWGLGKEITEAKSYPCRNSVERRLRIQNLVTRRASTHQLHQACPSWVRI